MSFDEFREIVQETSLHKNIPFPLESSDFVKLYFGKDKSRVITYAEFSQFLHDFHDEYAQVGTFSQYSKDNSSHETLIFCAVLLLAILGRLQMPRNLIYVNKSFDKGQLISKANFEVFI